jgi:hypothetical protein
MLEPEASTTASLAAKLNTSPKTAHSDKEEEKKEPRQTLLTSTLKKTRSMKEAKPKEAGGTGQN